MVYSVICNRGVRTQYYTVYVHDTDLEVVSRGGVVPLRVEVRTSYTYVVCTYMICCCMLLLMSPQSATTTKLAERGVAACVTISSKLKGFKEGL